MAVVPWVSREERFNRVLALSQVSQLVQLHRHIHSNIHITQVGNVVCVVWYIGEGQS